MWTWHQILIVSGVVFEIASAMFAANKVHNPFKSKNPKFDKKSNMWIMKKVKMRKLISDDQKMSIKDQIADAMKIWLFALILLVIGVVLQGIAAFV